MHNVMAMTKKGNEKFITGTKISSLFSKDFDLLLARWRLLQKTSLKDTFFQTEMSNILD